MIINQNSINRTKQSYRNFAQEILSLITNEKLYSLLIKIGC